MVKLLVCGDVKAPERKDGDAGIDFYVPNYSEDFVKQLKECNNSILLRSDGTGIIVRANEDILIPLNVRALIDKDVCIRMSNKSGIATKQKLTIGAEIIDHSYQGIMHVHLFNQGKYTTIIEFGQKIVQGVPIKIDNAQIEVVKDMSMEEFYKDHNSERGEGGFGSTGL